MHSRIFQISKEPNAKPISEDIYLEDFVPSIADYVVKVEKPESIKSDYEWLAKTNKGIEVKTDENGITTLTIVSKKDYFEKSFNNFKEYLKKVSNYTLDDFINRNNWLDMYNLKDSYEDKHGFYIDDNDQYFGLVSLDNFMRNVEEGEVFYLSNVFDYHF